MPSAFYRALTPADLDAVVAYLRSLPAVANATPAPVYRAPFDAEVLPDANPAPAPADAAARGRYLMNAAYCMSCHGRGADRRLDAAAPGRGGHVMRGPWGEKPVSNVTADREAGVGAWTDAELDRALTEGVGRDGEAFIPPMARSRFYGRMTPADRADIVAALRELAPSR